MIGTLCWSAGHPPNSELVEDCRQEARLRLWQIRERLENLPDAKREAYAYACVRRAAWRLIRCERERVAGTVPRGALTATDGREPPDERAGRWETFIGDDLLGQVERPEIADALSALSSRDYSIVDLFYTQGWSDADIAGHLGGSPAAVKVQRGRVLAKLRRFLQADAPPDSHDPAAADAP